jgi:hypothetical protein
MRSAGPQETRFPTPFPVARRARCQMFTCGWPGEGGESINLMIRHLEPRKMEKRATARAADDAASRVLQRAGVCAVTTRAQRKQRAPGRRSGVGTLHKARGTKASPPPSGLSGGAEMTGDRGCTPVVMWLGEQ